MIDFKSYFHDKYRGGENFIENIILPIFGEDKYEDAYEEDVLENNPELIKMAQNTGVAQIIRLGTINIPMNPTDVFDITVYDHVKMKSNRVTVQQLIRRIMSTYSSAFMIFHYIDEDKWDWRFSFCSKQGNNQQSTDSKRYTFLLGPNQSCRTAAENFQKLLDKQGDVNLKDIIEAFDVEALSKEFFDKYKAKYEKFCNYIYCNRSDASLFGHEFTEWDEKLIRDYVKKLLGRIVFLHFLQKKGWLGVPVDKQWGEGDTQFMRNLFNASTQEQKDNYLDCVLEPLFAGALNTQRPNDIFDLHVEGFCTTRIPYLNGGLFELDELDEPKSTFPASYFEDLFDFFYQYNFTIDENDPNDAEVGIDPEMLGHIFENLLEDNKDKGAFYTPKEIVQYMCRESLIAYLTTCVIKKQGENHKPEDKISESVRQLLTKPEDIVPKMTKEHLDEFGSYIRNVKICDPAIGSGAFPMGLLNELVRCRVFINAWAKDEKGNLLEGDYAALKTEIISNNIYGVDIEKGAIDIARLRFWLSIIVDEQNPHVLPNFDYKFMQGNSLIPTFDGKYINLDTKSQQHINVNAMRKEKQHLYELKQKYYQAEGEAKHELNVQIKDTILKLISRQLGYESRSWYQNNMVEPSLSIDDVTNMSFDEVRKTLPEDKLKSIALAESLHAKLNDTSIPVAERSQINIYFFDWRIMFTEVFDNGNDGFDIVIGNPPYLRIQELRKSNNELAEYLSSKYKSATGCFDLYVTFVEQGLKLVKPIGVMYYIMPVKWTNSSFGKGLRGLLCDRSFISSIINFEAYQIFNASTYTGIHCFKHSDFLSYLELDRDIKNNQELHEYLNSITQSDFVKIKPNTSEAWILTNRKVNSVLEKLNKLPLRLSDVFDKIFQGIATSKDDVYFLYNCHLTNSFEIEGFSKYLKKNVTIEKGLVKPLLKGEDVHRYEPLSSDRYVIFPYNLSNGRAELFSEQQIANLFPKGYSYLKDCEEELRGREKGRFNNNKWYIFGRGQGINYGGIPKLLAPEISFGGNFMFDSNGLFYSTTTIYGYIKNDRITISYETLLAIMNSKLCWWFLKNTGTVLANGYYRYKPAYLNPMPIPNIQKEDDFIIKQIVNKIIKSTDEVYNKELEEELESYIHKIYGLSREDSSIVMS